MKLGINLDDVTAVCAVPYLRRFADRFGVDLPDETEIGWHLLDRSEVKPALRDEFRLELYDSPFFGELDVYPECPDVLERLAKAGHELHFITARAEKRRAVTETWLVSKGLLRHARGVHLKPRGDFTPPATGRYDARSSAHYKLRVASELGLDAFCEDDEVIARVLADGGITVYLFDQPWNRLVEHSRVRRVTGWEQLGRELGV
ncbi:hypothetical protein BH18CHL2_BH18CHL2_02120 [soil metagenome]